MICSFIELTTLNGKRAAVEVGSIRMITEEDNCCVIRFKNLSGATFNDGDEKFPTGIFKAKESYDVIKAKIMEVGRHD